MDTVIYWDHALKPAARGHVAGCIYSGPEGALRSHASGVIIRNLTIEPFDRALGPDGCPASLVLENGGLTMEDCLLCGPVCSATSTTPHVHATHSHTQHQLEDMHTVRRRRPYVQSEFDQTCIIWCDDS